ncbi:hypothetical protein ACU4GD_10960 [Cupriavidus basilensis]
MLTGVAGAGLVAAVGVAAGACPAMEAAVTPPLRLAINALTSAARC